MNAFMFVIGLLGAVLCGLKIRSAWKGKSGVPIGTLIGGSVLGDVGASVGSKVAGDDKKIGTKPNIGGVIFWSLFTMVWVAVMIGGLFAK